MSAENASPSSASVIGADVIIVGQIQSASSIRVDGQVEGELEIQGDLVLGKEGTIKGNLTVQSVTIAGTMQGNIIAKDRIEMKSSAKVHGDIKAKRLAVEDGVTFIGRSEVNPSGTSAASPSEEKAAPPKQGQSGQQGQQGGNQKG